MRTVIRIDADERGRPDEIEERFARWLSLLLRRSGEDVTVILSGPGEAEPRYSARFRGEGAVAEIPLLAFGGMYRPSPAGGRPGERLDSLLNLFEIIYIPRREGKAPRVSPLQCKGDGGRPVYVRVTLGVAPSAEDGSVSPTTGTGVGWTTGPERDEIRAGDIRIDLGCSPSDSPPTVAGLLPPPGCSRRLPVPSLEADDPTGLEAVAKAWLTLHREAAGRAAESGREWSRGATSVHDEKPAENPSAEDSETRENVRIDWERTRSPKVSPALGKRRLQILLVGGFAPFPPLTGAQVREWELIRSLSGRHRLTVALLTGDMDRRVSTGKTLVLENGTRTDRVVPLVEPAIETMLFMGILSYYPNLDGILHFAGDILPRITRRLPGARLLVAGRDPGPKIRLLGEHPNIEVIADPPDMLPLAARSGVAIVPVRVGSGTRIKILESMAWGLPVVRAFPGSRPAGAVANAFRKSGSATQCQGSLTGVPTRHTPGTVTQPNRPAHASRSLSTALSMGERSATAPAGR